MRSKLMAGAGLGAVLWMALAPVASGQPGPGRPPGPGASAGKVVACPTTLDVSGAAPPSWGVIARRPPARVTLTNGLIPSGGPLVCRYGTDELMLTPLDVGGCRPQNPQEWGTQGGTDTQVCATGAPLMPPRTNCAAICQ
ncbi:hypothetical protein [Phenylobacterium sp.]|uniref:hypothetical protein n=1 Tax=Phenylobacterium sp. TaxID=1871053 RepID=UPI002CDEC470|nr:hypothetical protein [Phenylobacterium sp.]HVI31223.1 hypothetical protein [Phenylobacterium sp.]